MQYSSELIVWMSLVAAWWVGRLGEERMDRINTRFLVLAGAVEHFPRRMASFYRLLLYMLPVAAMEFRWRDLSADKGLMTLSVTALLLSGALRLWAIRALGWQWTLKCLVHPAAPRQRRGPYQYFGHPEYLTRFVDGAAICLFIGASYSAVSYLILSYLVLRPIVREENLLLEESATRYRELKQDPELVPAAEIR
jgi:methyltransferase